MEPATHASTSRRWVIVQGRSRGTCEDIRLSPLYNPHPVPPQIMRFPRCCHGSHPEQPDVGYISTSQAEMSAMPGSRVLRFYNSEPLLRTGSV